LTAARPEDWMRAGTSLWFMLKSTVERSTDVHQCW